MNWPDDYVNKIIQGDCRDVMKGMPDERLVIITDPVWPNVHPDLIGLENSFVLFARAAKHFPRIAKRVIIQLGCDSDPRFLFGIPAALEFKRVVSLRYARPSYHGRLLRDRDMAYIFGDLPQSRPGLRVMPGEFTHTKHNAFKPEHPCPRQLSHVKWLVSKYTEEDDIILDPFAGAGTTGVAAFLLDRKYICIEIEKRFCEEAERYLVRAAEQLKLALK